MIHNTLFVTLKCLQIWMILGLISFLRISQKLCDRIINVLQLQCVCRQILMAMMSIVRLGYSRQPLQLDQISNIMSHGDSDCSDIKDLAPPKESIKDQKGTNWNIISNGVWGPNYSQDWQLWKMAGEERHPADPVFSTAQGVWSRLLQCSEIYTYIHPTTG